MNLNRSLFTLLITITTYGFLFAQEVSVLSWNIKDLGQTKSDVEIAFMVSIMKDFDIIAIQEVVAKHPAGVQKVVQLAERLNRTGSKWDYRYSDPTTGTPYEKERYAFIWKTAVVKLQKRPWLDKALAPIVCREPYLARFSIGQNSVLIANYHSIPHAKNPQWENEQVLKLPQLYPDDTVLIAGDYNISSADKFWNILSDTHLKLIPYGHKTTLRKACTKSNKFTYSNHAIDFFIYEQKEMNISKSSVVDYVDECERLELARSISDHLPVYCRFNLLSRN